MNDVLHLSQTETKESVSGRAQAAEPPRTHVLIVDDDGSSRLVCANYCDLFDHTSDDARGASDAVSALRRTRFDVVVINVHMAACGGLKLLNAIRALPGLAGQTPVVGMTAVGRDDEAQRWLAAGLAAVVAKPVTAARFFAAVSAASEPVGPSERSWAPAR